MIVLDTDVVSETLKLQPSLAVLAWLDAQLAETLYLSTDGYIAATAAFRGFAVASRDASAFDACGLQAINPWMAASSPK